MHYLAGLIFNQPGFASASVEGEDFLAGALVPSMCCVPRDGGYGTINEQTGALIVGPIPDSFSSATIPHLGTFRLTPCRLAQC